MSGEPKDLTIDTSMVQADLEADPALAGFVKEFCAAFRQAVHAVQTGQHRTIDEALRAMGIDPVKVDPTTGEEITGASLQDDMEAGGFDLGDDGVEVHATIQRITDSNEDAMPGNLFVSASCDGERCGFNEAPFMTCSEPAEHKVEEVVFDDDPIGHRHPLTCYVCHRHFRMLMGQMADRLRAQQRVRE